MVEPIRDAIHAARDRRPGCALVLSIVAPPDVVRQYEAVGCPVFEDPTRAVRSVRGTAPVQPDLRGGCGRSPLGGRGRNVRRQDHRTSPTEPSRRPHLGTGGETPSLRGGSADRERRAGPNCRRGRTHRRRVRRAGGGQAVRTRRSAQDRARRRGAGRVERNGGAPGLRVDHGARPRGGPGGPQRGRADCADGLRRHRDDPRRPPRPNVRTGRHVRSGWNPGGGDRGRQLPRGAVRRSRGAPDDRGDPGCQGVARNAREGARTTWPPWRRPSHVCRSSRQSTATGSTAPRSTRSSCSRKVTAPWRSTP